MLGSDRRSAVYTLALLAGLGLALYMFPVGFIDGQMVRNSPPPGDSAQHIVGQRYFLAQAWHWPLLVADRLVPPGGTSIAFTDSIPLLSVATKLVSGLLPPGIETISFWLAFCWVLQPVSAVFALRSTGERRLIPNLAVAMMSLGLPTLYWRSGHAALCSHFLLLLALGSYFLLLRGVTLPRLLFAVGLMLTSLLVHPYLMVMVMALLAAAPVSLLLRGGQDWIRAAIGLSAGVAVTAGVASVFGYTGARPSAGFGYYSMNILAPIYPARSPLFPWAAGAIDATGGQYEGFQYLGAGLLLLIVVAFGLVARRPGAILRRHGGLVAVGVCLTLFALSTRVYLGHSSVLHTAAPAMLGHFRASGRFFWPVTYTLLIGSIAIVSRFTRPAMALPLLIGAGVLQLVDTADARNDMRSLYRGELWQWKVDAATLRQMIQASNQLNIWPTLGCGADADAPAYVQLLLLGSERAIQVNTMRTSRESGNIACDPRAYTQRALAPGELRVFLPGVPQAMWIGVLNWQARCRQLGDLLACSEQLAK